MYLLIDNYKGKIGWITSERSLKILDLHWESMMEERWADFIYRYK